MAPRYHTGGTGREELALRAVSELLPGSAEACQGQQRPAEAELSLQVFFFPPSAPLDEITLELVSIHTRYEYG